MKKYDIVEISPVGTDDDENLWETVVDFTKIKKSGVPLLDVLSRL